MPKSFNVNDRRGNGRQKHMASPVRFSHRFAAGLYRLSGFVVVPAVTAKAAGKQCHGILVMGKTMEECFDQAELLEDTAKIAFLQQLACLR